MSAAKILSNNDLISATDPDQIREIGRNLLEIILRHMVVESVDINVKIKTGNRTTVFIVACPRSCLGRIIGISGRNINGLRSLMSTIMGNKGIRCVIEIPYYRID